MLYALTYLLLAITPAASLNHNFQPLSATDRARRAVAAKPTTFNCDIVSCGAATGGARQATKYCASYMGSPVVTRTVYSGSTTVGSPCSSRPPTTTTSTPFPEPYCLHRAYPKSEICSCLSIPSDYTVFITTTEIASYTGPFFLGLGTSTGLSRTSAPSPTGIFALTGEGENADLFVLRQDGALVDVGITSGNNGLGVAYQLPGDNGGLVLFDPASPSRPPSSSDILVNCHLYGDNSNVCNIGCEAQGASNPYLCNEGLYFAKHAPSGACLGGESDAFAVSY